MKLKTRLGLYLTEKRDSGYYHLIANVVTLGLTENERADIDSGATWVRATHDTIRNADRENGLYLANLRINSQGNDADTDRHLYGWDVEYRDVYSIDLRQAEGMAHTLKTIRRRMEKTDEKYGRPATFGAYVARVAVAIGADEIIRLDEKTPPRGWSYEDVNHRRTDIQSGVAWIDYLVKTWATEREKVSA